MGQASSEGEPAECDLGTTPALEPELESFLGELTSSQDVEGGCDLSPEPSMENYEVW